MKKINTIVSAVLFSAAFSFAQPSFTFETGWTNNPLGTPAYQEPAGWVSSNILSNTLFSLGGSPVSTFQSTDAHGGTYACKIKTVALTNPPSWWALQDTVGYLSAGRVQPSAPWIYIGSGYTQRPSTFEFWAKYTPNGTDTASTALFLMHDNGPGKDTIAVAYLVIATTTVSAYTKYVMPLIYNSAFPSTNPDTLLIAFSSSGRGNPKVNSELLIDDLAFGFPSGLDQNNIDARVTIYPNPASKEINFSLNSEAAKKINIMNTAGQQIGTYTISDKAAKINAEKFAAGVYVYTVNDKDGNVLNTGRFTITQ